MPELLQAEKRRGSVAAERGVSTSAILKHYLASAALYGLLLLLFAVNPWYKQLLSVSIGSSTSSRSLSALELQLQRPNAPPPGQLTAMKFYEWLYVIYLGVSLPTYLILRPRSLLASKNVLIWGVARRVAQAALWPWAGNAGSALALSHEEKRALMFLLVKLIYGPLMLNSAFIEIRACDRCIQMLQGMPRVMGWNAMDFGYIMFVHLVFVLDSCLFFIGYHTEASFLKNELKEVETNVWRILVCIACYPPFNLVTTSVLGSSLEDPYILVGGDFRGIATWMLRAGAVLFLVLLISSSLSLFTRASNLTNRGIVSWGPYRYVRHPGYFAKNMFWLMTLIPALIPNPSSMFFSWKSYCVTCLCTAAGFLGWATLYYLRAITEEQFLRQDPEYVAYCQRVKYRFIPGVY
jgi:protein-S-isoprenylcysteine O-methyltransferase Ste14